MDRAWLQPQQRRGRKRTRRRIGVLMVDLLGEPGTRWGLGTCLTQALLAAAAMASIVRGCGCMMWTNTLSGWRWILKKHSYFKDESMAFAPIASLAGSRLVTARTPPNREAAAVGFGASGGLAAHVGLRPPPPPAAARWPAPLPPPPGLAAVPH